MALQAQHSNSTPFLEISPEKDNIEIPVRLDSKRPKVRQRANSKVYGNGSSSTPASQTTSSTTNTKNGGLVTNGNGSITQNIQDAENKVSKLLADREKFIHILVLTSMNGTFERKTLEIPHFPVVLKLGRPNSSQKAPDPRNGYFDSRVISREHAQLTVKDGKMFIDDLNSANGTFLNSIKILKEQILKKNDTIELGVNIDNDNNSKHHHHRRICCQVSDILTLPLDSTTDKSKLFEDLAAPNSKLTKDGTETKLLSAFDAAMFGDVTEDLDDVALGISHDFLTGIFVNNNIGTNDNLVRSIRSLINQVHLERVNNLKLASVEKLLDNFKTQLANDEDVLRYQKYKKQNEKLQKTVDEITQKVSRLAAENEMLINKTNNLLAAKNEEVRSLKKSLGIEEEANLRLTEQIQDLNSLVHSRDVDLSNMQSESFMNNVKYGEEINDLKAKLDARDNVITELEAAKQKELDRKSKKHLVKDMTNLTCILLGVVAIGVSVLRWN